AEGDANKVWIVPSEIGKALEGLGSTMNSLKGIPDEVDGPVKRVDMGATAPSVEEIGDYSDTQDEVAAAIAAAEQASNPGAGTAAAQAAAEPDAAPAAAPETGPETGSAPPE